MATTVSSFSFPHIPTTTTLRCCSVPHHQLLFAGRFRPTVNLPRRIFSPSVLVYSRRRNSTTSATTSSSSSKKKEKRSFPDTDFGTDDDLDEDAFEALFRQLEEDLKHDDSAADFDDDDEITEEDLAKLEEELAKALGDDELLGVLDSSFKEIEDIDENENSMSHDDDGDEEDESPVKLKNWQLRRLAYALKKGRRKTSIKNLAADLCLDRAVVLELLREPPPNLLMLSAALPDKPDSSISVPETKAKAALDTSSLSSKVVPLETSSDVVKDEAKMNVPVHIMQSSWSARKRLKKVQLETLEKVYRRTKRPTNAMISSIVHVTNLPRKRIVKWFEEKRAEDGVPDHRLPYQRQPDPENVATS